MRRRLRRHPKANSDVEESAVYLGRDNLDAALRFLDAVEATLNMLVENPEIGLVREFSTDALAGVRSFPVKGFDNHLVFYRAHQDGIDVLRVLHGARDLGSILDA